MYADGKGINTGTVNRVTARKKKKKTGKNFSRGLNPRLKYLRDQMVKTLADGIHLG